MRSTEAPQTAAERFGALITDLAIRAGYDLAPGGPGRADLARDTGMSVSAVGRMVTGKTLPMPQQLEALARAVHVDVRTLLVTAGVISDHAWPKGASADVASGSSQQPLSPEAVADMWGITEPSIRSMLISTAQHVIRLQNEADGRRGQGEAIGKR
ncbi:helix-turn-helix domain-containing protein [Streptomyces sp. NPDC057250]|uniref:helix-turn-helix domain-containing protein n=1 Tax=Streptomyces sp. NPDC057250 TaxID=3346068 RepID=UPI0036288674